MTTKLCIKCNTEQDITLFERNNSRGKEGTRNVCRSCRKEQYTQLRQKKSELIDYSDTTKSKKCVVCDKEHNILEYNRNKNKKDGYHDICKKCDSIKRKEEYQERKNRIIITNITYKICYECKTNKEITKFKQTSRSKDGYFQICIDCRPDNWTKEKQRESEKKYVLANKDKLKEKWKNDGKKITRRIRDSLNHRISEIFKSNKSNKQNKTFHYLGCNKEYFKKWFEFLFDDNMTWENYGQWHIDHVIPCKSFNLTNEEEQKKCFSWKNLRPCWATENISKGSKILPNVIESHEKKVSEFINSTTKLI